jgi:hypothetical protein
MVCSRLLLFTSLKPKLFVYNKKPYKLSLVYRKLVNDVNHGQRYGPSDVLVTEQHTSMVTKEEGLAVFDKLNSGWCVKCGHVSKCSVDV